MSQPRHHPPSAPPRNPHLENPAERQAQADRVILQETRQHHAPSRGEVVALCPFCPRCAEAQRTRFRVTAQDGRYCLCEACGHVWFMNGRSSVS